MDPYQFSLNATVWGQVPSGGGAPDPGLISRAKSVLQKYGNNRYVKLINWAYATYNALEDELVPGPPGRPTRVPPELATTIRERLGEVVPGYTGTPEDLQRLREWVERSADLDVPGAEDAIVTHMGQQWLVDP